jgi:mRNA-degrading endonuclease RelE of RelBE toxin-antitoxin system
MFEFIETPLFTKILPRYLNDDDYAKLQNALNAQPEAGDLVPGSGGVRKMRWGVQGRGKRGGLRVIYYFRTTRGLIWMLTLYAKNVRESIPAHVLKELKETIDDAKDD